MTEWYNKEYKDKKNTPSPFSSLQPTEVNRYIQCNELRDNVQDTMREEEEHQTQSIITW